MHIGQESLDHKVKLITQSLELLVFKSEDLIIFEIYEHADEHPEGFFLSDPFLVRTARAAEAEYQGGSQEIHPLHIPQLLVVQSDASEHPLKLCLTLPAPIPEILQRGQGPI